MELQYFSNLSSIYPSLRLYTFINYILFLLFFLVTFCTKQLFVQNVFLLNVSTPGRWPCRWGPVNQKFCGCIWGAQSVIGSWKRKQGKEKHGLVSYLYSYSVKKTQVCHCIETLGITFWVVSDEKKQFNFQCLVLPNNVALQLCWAEWSQGLNSIWVYPPKKRLDLKFEKLKVRE